MGNLLVVYAVVCDHKMRSSVTNLLITNLAIADLLIMVFGVPEIVLVMMNEGWLLSQIVCKVNRFVLVMSLYSAVMTLVAICVERYSLGNKIYFSFYSILYPVLGEYQIQSVCLCVCLSGDSCPMIDLRC